VQRGQQRGAQGGQQRRRPPAPAHGRGNQQLAAAAEQQHCRKQRAALAVGRRCAAGGHGYRHALRCGLLAAAGLVCNKGSGRRLGRRI
jgi:hypothetical protein